MAALKADFNVPQTDSTVAVLEFETKKLNGRNLNKKHE
jgi:hypothetical protein